MQLQLDAKLRKKDSEFVYINIMNKLKFKFLRVAPRSPRTGPPISPRIRMPLSPRNLLSPRRFLSPTNDNRPLTKKEPKSPDLLSTETNHVENDSIQAVNLSLSSHSSRDSTDSATIDSNVRDNGPIDCDTVRKYRHRKVRTKLGGRVSDNDTMGTAVPRMPQIVESPMSYNSSSIPSNYTIPTIITDGVVAETPAPESSEIPPAAQDGNLGLSLLRSKMPSFKRIRSQSNPNISAAFALASENGITEDIATTNSDLDPHTAANVAQVMVVESHPTSSLKASTSSLSASTVKTEVNDPTSASLLKYLTPSLSASAETQESNFINGNNVMPSNPLATTTDCSNSKNNINSDNNNNSTEDKYSPSSVLCELFDSVYPVEIDPEGTSCDDSSVDHHYGSNIFLPDMRSLSGTHDSILSIAEDLAYETTVLCTSGQDASNSTDVSDIIEDIDNKCPKMKGTNKSSNSPHHKEFLELKKVEEKNEFKMVIALKQNSTATLASLSRSSSSESNMDKYFNKLELIDDLTKVTSNDKEVQPTEFPPDVIIRSRSTSPTEYIAFPEDSAVASNLPSEQDLERVQDSLSTDSDNESYMSLESIGDITICDETKRLLNAHTLYADDAKTNSNHPARQKKSVLRVGSIFKSLENNNSNSDDFSSSMSAAAPSITTFSRTMRLLGATDEGSDDSSIRTTKNNAKAGARSRHRLSWYDDEKNWNKPFTLRTDATFDASSSLRSMPSTMSEYNVMDQFIGDFINGLCASRGDVDFDIDEQEEI